MKDLEEEERKKFMEQQMNYMDGLTRKTSSQELPNYVDKFYLLIKYNFKL